MKQLLTFGFLLSFFFVSGQVPVLVKDIYKNGQSSPSQFTPSGNILYFTANDGIAGNELWRSDGTEAGTYLVKDIYPGLKSSFIGDIIELNGHLFFFAEDNMYGRELWKSNGTTQGTVLLKELTPGTGSVAYGPMFKMGNHFYLFLRDQNGEAYFYKNDGINEQNVPVKQMGKGGSPRMVPFNDQSFFLVQALRADSSVVWLSDGTTNGTKLICTLPGNIEYQSFSKIYNGTLFFALTSTKNGSELWKTDGTAAGTKRVKDLYPGSQISLPKNFFNYNGKLLLNARDKPDGAEELWISDGTEDGTHLLKEPSAARIIYPSAFCQYKNEVYFSAHSIGIGEEVFKTNGTSEGTLLLTDLVPGSNSLPSDFLVHNGYLYFTAIVDMGTGKGFLRRVIRTNGTEAGTTKGTLDETNYVEYYESGDLIKAGNTVYFWAYAPETGTELWKLEDKVVTAITDPFFVYPSGSNNRQEFAYPNPATDFVHIYTDGNDGILQLINAEGKVVSREQIADNGIISTSHLPIGIYLLELIQESKVSRQKLCIK